MHLAIIPDGNRRWADDRKCSLKQAYAIGFCNVVALALKIVDEGLQVEVLTFFGLSGDNYSKRPRRQLTALFLQIVDSLGAASALLGSKGVHVHFIGNLPALPSQYRRRLIAITRETGGTRRVLRLNILINYSIAWDLPSRGRGLRTKDVPACDVVFRSGRSNRLSGFLPVQCAHAELFFSKSMWPDVRPSDVVRCVDQARAARRPYGA